MNEPNNMPTNSSWHLAAQAREKECGEVKFESG